MDELAYRPTPFAIWGVKLKVREPLNGGCQDRRKEAQGRDLLGANRWSKRWRWLEAANGIAEVFQICHSTENLRGASGDVAGEIPTYCAGAWASCASERA